jgi:NAD(P)-dependent dehydrogenase (short-subunit alcohol dehydrogenase family)
MTFGVDGRHALVTGGTRGIGRAIAARLAAAGAIVTILGRDPVAIDAAIGAREAHAGFVADVTEPDAFRRAIEDAVTRSGPVELLIANAGQALSAPFGRTDAALIQRMLDVNLFGVVHGIHAVLPSMIEAGFGRIVAVASTAGLKGYPYVSAYCAAKHAVVGLVRSLAVECATTGVTINAVCPGYTDTDLVSKSIERIAARTGRSRDDVLRELVRGNPQRRLIDPPEIADAVLWLCGFGARSVTGQAIAIAGGEI